LDAQAGEALNGTEGAKASMADLRAPRRPTQAGSRAAAA